MSSSSDHGSRSTAKLAWLSVRRHGRAMLFGTLFVVVASAIGAECWHARQRRIGHGHAQVYNGMEAFALMVIHGENVAHVRDRKWRQCGQSASSRSDIVPGWTCSWRKIDDETEATIVSEIGRIWCVTRTAETLPDHCTLVPLTGVRSDSE